MRQQPRLERIRCAWHLVALGTFSLTIAAGLNAGSVPGVPAPSAAPVEDVTLAMRPLEPDSPLAAPAYPAADWQPLAAPEPDLVQPAAAPATDDSASPVVTVASPLWVKNVAPTPLWSSERPDAQAFTDLPARGLMRVQGPAVGSRTPVYYVGDGLLRRPGNAWVETSLVVAVEPPAPGEIPAVDAFANRPLPQWVQVHSATNLWSGPDANAVQFTDLPQWTFLRVAGLERGGRLMVEFEGDYGTRQPGMGWVDQRTVGPAGDPGRWVLNHRPTALWSGLDERAQRFTDLPQWSKLRVVDGAPSSKDRLLVEFFGDSATRQPGMAWVPRADIGPITPPVPLPAVPTSSGGGGRQRQAYTFASQTDFIQTVGLAAQRSRPATGVPASVSVAQAILESDWGRSRLTRQANNLYGIKSQSGPGPAGSVTLPTWEYVDGEDIVVQAAFKSYFTVQESIEDHGRFFVRNRRYGGALAVADDPRAFARAIQTAGYATDPDYAAKLIRLMDRYDLYRFDR